MARAVVEVTSKSAQVGAIRIAAHQRFFTELATMFPDRLEMPIGGSTTGETCLDCINCMIHHVMDRHGRPAPINPEKVTQIEKLFSELPPDHLALYLLCPQLKTFSPNAGYFPCEKIGLMPIANT